MTPSERLVHLKNLDVLTSQEVFDLTVTALRIQGCKSENPALSGTVCVYRTPEGLACAAGHHIRDIEYKFAMEHMSIARIIEGGMYANLTARLLPHLALMRNLQRIHDASEPCEWEKEWRSLAVKCRLVYIPPGA